MFFAFPDSIKMTILSHTRQVVDATYKTNKYGMPLVHAIGVSSTYQTFSSIFCFMKSETGATTTGHFRQRVDCLGN